MPTSRVKTIKQDAFDCKLAKRHANHGLLNMGHNLRCPHGFQRADVVSISSNISKGPWVGPHKCVLYIAHVDIVQAYLNKRSHRSKHHGTPRMIRLLLRIFESSAG